MVPIIIPFLFLLLYLMWEQRQIHAHRKSIPLRIAVTGTRGKSTAVRLLASVLREHGKKVLAKTTGSQALFILADGTEEEIKRKKIPSILEQKKLLKNGAALGVDCIITEIMSIHPENHFVESQRIIKPHMVIITNVREDHIDAMGNDKDTIAVTLSQVIPPKSEIFISESEFRPAFQEKTDATGSTLHIIKKETFASSGKATFFQKQIHLIIHAASFLQIPERTIQKGIQKSQFDMGKWRIWTLQENHKGKTIFLVNGFAANDPESTKEVLEMAQAHLPKTCGSIFGLFNCRGDRGDRTLQWVSFLQNDHFFKDIFIIGDQTEAVRRKLNRGHAIKKKKPGEMMDIVFQSLEDQDVLFGFGNFGGLGKSCVQYWQSHGEKYEL